MDSTAIDDFISRDDIDGLKGYLSKLFPSTPAHDKGSLAVVDHYIKSNEIKRLRDYLFRLWPKTPAYERGTYAVVDYYIKCGDIEGLEGYLPSLSSRTQLYEKAALVVVKHYIKRDDIEGLQTYLGNLCIGHPAHETGALAVIEYYIKRNDKQGLRDYQKSHLSSTQESYNVATRFLEGKNKPNGSSSDDKDFDDKTNRLHGMIKTTLDMHRGRGAKGQPYVDKATKELNDHLATRDISAIKAPIVSDDGSNGLISGIEAALEVLRS